MNQAVCFYSNSKLHSINCRSKESKQRTGKSYLEERQRQAERREEQRKKLSQSQSSDYLSESKSNVEPPDKIVIDEDKKLQVKPIAADSETKEVDFKKERIFKKEELKKNSYKYSSNRDKEADESRKTRKSNNEKTYSSNKKDYERSEDSGRKRYSESRKGQDSIHRDRYKDKDKTKLSSQKKSSISTTDPDKNRNISNDPFKASGSSDPNKSMSKVSKESIDLPDEELIENSSTSRSNDTNKELNEIAKETIFETKDKVNPKRRKSLDNDKNRYFTTCTLNKVHAREKYTEKKRRNSVGSSNPIKGSTDIKSYEDDKNHSHYSIKKSQSKENILIPKRYLNSAEFDASINKNNCVLENVKDDSEESNKVKRRNSTGETQGSVCEPTRRNSLGTDYKHKIGVVTVHKITSKETNKKDKTKYEKKMQQNNRDPRTERRIRNKVRILF